MTNKASESQQSIKRGMPIRVLHVVTALNVGGIETYLLRVLNYVNRRQFNMDVCYHAADPGTYADQFRAAGTNLYRVAHKFLIIPYVWKLSALLKKGRYQAICDFGGDFAAASMLAGYLVGLKRRIVFYRSSGISHRADPLRMCYRRCARRMVTRLATHVLSNSEANFKAFFPNRTAGKESFHVIPNGVDLQEFAPVDAAAQEIAKSQFGLSGRFVIGHVGGFKPVKNHLFMIRLFARLRSVIPNASLLLVGDGNLRPQIEDEIEQRRLMDAVVLAGRRMDVAACLAAMDVFWFPSRFEGLPNAMIEAQAAGLPIVASRVGGVLEHIPASGLPYAIDLDADEEWLKAIARLADSEEERISQGRVNREHAAEHYALKPRLDQFLSYFESDSPLSATDESLMG